MKWYFIGLLALSAIVCFPVQAGVSRTCDDARWENGFRVEDEGDPAIPTIDDTISADCEIRVEIPAGQAVSEDPIRSYLLKLVTESHDGTTVVVNSGPMTDIIDVGPIRNLPRARVETTITTGDEQAGQITFRERESVIGDPNRILIFKRETLGIVSATGDLASLKKNDLEVTIQPIRRKMGFFQIQYQRTYVIANAKLGGLGSGIRRSIARRIMENHFAQELSTETEKLADQLLLIPTVMATDSDSTRTRGSASSPTWRAYR